MEHECGCVGDGVHVGVVLITVHVRVRAAPTQSLLFCVFCAAYHWTSVGLGWTQQPHAFGL